VSKPYYRDKWVTLYHGDCRELLPSMHAQLGLVVADPPYGETSLEWDRWPEGWPSILGHYTKSMWCFGSMRMFLDRRAEFRAWKLSQDVVWEKHNGSGFHADRFRRIHEHALHWYRGDWTNIYHEVPTTPSDRAKVVRRKQRPAHTGHIEAGSYRSEDGGPLLMTSVIYAPSMHGNAINETEKPVGILTPLIEYGCPPDEIVLDPFAGSCSTLVAARLSGRKSIGIELRESQCEVAAKRLSQEVLDFGAVS
jgi:site-specific DNA-methyltransferase (adenine-specific)